MFDSKPPNFLAYRSGDPGVFHSRCHGLWTHVTLLGLARTTNSCRSAPHITRVDYIVIILVRSTNDDLII